MQEFGGLDAEVRPAGSLFIDSGGEGGTLMVREHRYAALDLPTAAMALFAMQTQAPAGGRGNLTSLRGGGPMISLVDPGQGLWPLIWANVPAGAPAAPDVLPWMRKMQLSAEGRQYFPHQAWHPAEVMFGMPRRLWLVADGDRVTGVMQRPAGVKYAGFWRHPLTPSYRTRPGEEPLPVRPRAGHFGYRNWLGIAAKMTEDSLRDRAPMVEGWEERSGGAPAQVIVAGWAMENMKARDFILSRAPLVDLDAGRALCLTGMVEAAELLAVSLLGALAPVLAEGEAREAAREAFFLRTRDDFEARLEELTTTGPARFEKLRDELVRGWLADMRRAALSIFEALALPGLSDRPTEEQQRIVSAHASLAAAFPGRTPQGKKAFGKLLLDPPAVRKRDAA
jgi:CRISPR system Cascade subunit CasA